MIFTAKGLRDWPYSDDENVVSANLVNLYFDFASKSSAVYSNVNLEACKIHDIKYLEISGPNDFKITSDEHFGNFKFWDDIEGILATDERTYYDEL